MTHFLYSQIGSALITALVESVVNEKSVLIVGHRYGGKTYLLRQLRDRLQSQRHLRTIPLGLSSGSRFLTERHVRIALQSAIQSHFPDCPDYDQSGDLLTPLDWAVDHSTLRVALLVSNVDEMSSPLAAQLLQG